MMKLSQLLAIHLILAASIFLPIVANTASAASFKLDANGSEPLYQSTLPKNVYQQSRADDLQDLSISNAAGEQVPYALLRYFDLHPQTTTTLDTKPLLAFAIKESSLNNPSEINIELQKNAQNTSLSLNLKAISKQVRTTYLIDLGKKHRPLQTLAIDWQSNDGVLLALEVLASDDLKNWSAVGDGVLLKTSSLELLQNTITLNSPTEARYLQIRPANQETLILNKVSAQYNNVRALAPEILWQDIPQIEREQDNKNGNINIDFESLGRYPTSYLRVQLPQNNTITSAIILVRNKNNAPWQHVTSASLYCMNKAAKTYTNPNITFSPTVARYWRLQFNQSSGGIGADNPNVSLGWLPSTVVWNARGQAPFTLIVGEKLSILNKVSIASLIADYKIEKIQTLPKSRLTSEVSANNGANVQATNTWVAPVDYKRWLLWGGLFLGVLLLAGMAFSLLKTNNKD